MKQNIRKKEIIKIFEKYSELEVSPSDPDIFATIEKIKESSASDTEARALLAVHITLFMLRVMGKSEELDLVCDIYISKGRSHSRDLAMEIRRRSFEAHRDERTLYRLIANTLGLYTSVLSELLRDTASESMENNFSS